jgi:tRNA (guanine37-N1)-methyltransferase
MRIDIISAVPEILASPLKTSIIKRSLAKKLVEIRIHNLHDYSSNKYKSVDDYQYGGGSGMVLQIEPIFNCINRLKNEREYDDVIYMSPDGLKLSQSVCNKFSSKGNLIILCGHYKGVDQRVRDNLITKEISIGDYVLTGGEIPALIFIDSIVRLIPGVLNSEDSALTDSFQDNLLSYPIYSRPRKFKQWEVPEILFSGNHKKIDKWREDMIINLTKKKRPDLL